MGQENLGVAFALVIFAGASTAIGASVVFFPSLVKYASKRTLAAGLGLSAGVMTYVSFVEIFQKSVGGFVDAGINDDTAYVYATLCFFTGIFLMVVMNFVVHQLLLGTHDNPHNSHHHRNRRNHHDEDDDSDESEEDAADAEAEASTRGMPPICCAQPEKMEQMRQMGAELEEQEHQQYVENNNINPQGLSGGLPVARDDDESGNDDTTDRFNAEDTTTRTDGTKKKISKEEARRLNKMSLNTAIAIAMHNFPEGLATFVAALADPRVGAVLAIAIAIHNVPEGLCVSLPVYYATGDRCRAFSWGCLSGLSEPVAAVLGWAVLANNFSNEMYGVLFGMVSGMMVIISAKELLPTAHRYDSDDSLVTNAFIIGMAIMALSLVLFLL